MSDILELDQENFKIETDRLLMHRVKPDDSKALLELCTDERLYKYLRRFAFKTQEEIYRWLQKKERRANADVLMIASDRIDGHVVGLYAASLDTVRNSWNISYITGFDDWGKGFATEAMKAIMDYMSSQFHPLRFEGECAKANPASAHVMKKLGLQYVGDSSYEKHDGSRCFASEIYQSRVFL